MQENEMRSYFIACGLIGGMALAGCDGKPPDTGDTADPPCGGDPATDDDGDHLSEARGDCNDCDMYIHPGASETPSSTSNPCTDGLDNDCDGAVDTVDSDCATPGGSTTDLDHDGYAWPEDCDDSNPDIYPGAEPELIGDEVDQNCDGAERCNVDADDDGYVDDPDSYVESPDVSCKEAGEATNTTPLGDCDDTRDWISPAGAEVCDVDDLDEDCDGLADDYDEGGAEGKVDWYFDGDIDGFGKMATDDPRCDPPEGYVALGGDCDDDHEWISPEGVEECDEDNFNEDCDGGADDRDPEGDAEGQVEWYLDSDGDGYGAGEAIVACDEPDMTYLAVSNYVRKDGDCNDVPGEGEAFYPTAPDNCVDGLDQDCDDPVLADEGAFVVSNVTVGTSSGPVDIITADLLDDVPAGLYDPPDLVVAGYASGFVYVLHNDDHGSFSIPSGGYSDAGFGVRGLTRATIWSSTVDDLVAVVGTCRDLTSCGDTNYAYAMKTESDGTPTFMTKTSFSPNGSDPRSVASLDLKTASDTLVVGDNDTCSLYFYDHSGEGHYDLRSEGTLNVEDWTHTGCGSTESGPIDLVVDDLNGDGLEDIASANAALSSFSAVAITEDTSASYTGDSTYLVSGGRITSITTGDWDGDGSIDVAVADKTYGYLYTYGYAGAFDGVPAYSVGESLCLGNALGLTATSGDSDGCYDTAPDGLASANLNSDLPPELVVVMSGTSFSSVLIYPNDSGSFATRTPLVVTVGTDPREAAVADFDGDGDVDLAVANYGTSDVSILLNQCTP